MTASISSSPEVADSPARAPLGLIALILSAAIANLNLAVANVATPAIGAASDASRIRLNLIDNLGGLISVVVGGAVPVASCFPRKDAESALIARYHTVDTASWIRCLL